MKKELKWWKTIDVNDPLLSQLYFRMYGSLEQRISQLYVIRNNINFKLNG